MAIEYHCIQHGLTRLFYAYGKVLARHPLPFILAPILLTFLLGFGFMEFSSEMNTEVLFTPRNGPAKDERRIINDLFPENETHLFIPNRRTNNSGAIQVILTRKDGKNVYNTEGISFALKVDELITQRLRVRTTRGTIYNYYDLCARLKGQCFLGNQILRLLDYNASNVDQIDLGFPTHRTPNNFTYYLGNVLSRVQVKPKTNFLVYAEAIYFVYFFRSSQKVMDITAAFLRQSVEELRKISNDTEYGLTYVTSKSLDDVLNSGIYKIVILFLFATLIILSFAALSCYSTDPVRSKMWVAVGGEVAATLSIISTFGLLSMLGFKFSPTVGCMPFLLIGIGIDDMFVLISCFRQTDFTLPVEERIGKTLQIAAVSITLTSVTDTLSFGIGAITVFESVTAFCAYAGVCCIFCYFYVITFAGACLVYSARVEHANRHNTLFCIKVLPATFSEYERATGCKKACCFGGHEYHFGRRKNRWNISNATSLTSSAWHADLSSLAVKKNSSVSQQMYNKNEADDIITNKSGVEQISDNTYIPLVTYLIKTYIAPPMLHPATKVIVILLECLYITMAVRGLTILEQGLDVKNLAPDNSYVIEFNQEYEKYFQRQDGFQIMVVFTDPLDYSNPVVQGKLVNELQKFRNTPFLQTNDTLTESWLSTYLAYLLSTNQTTPNISTFTYIFRTRFLSIPRYSRYIADIHFSDDLLSIDASRFMLQTQKILGITDSTEVMKDARRVASKSSYNITVFTAGFVFFDLNLVILSNTLQNIGIAVACMMFVSMLLLPNMIAIFFVTLSVLSICIGVIGFMAMWDIGLDPISMICLIMSIGFSVDFSAHISYHFAISKSTDGDEKAAMALSDIGWPILQGALSTILGVIVLAFSDTYIFRTFFKIIFLVMVFGFWHAFFVLPVLLSLTHRLCGL